MKYYIIAGEASGDLHASHLMQALKERDAEADFRFFGGDLMSAVGGTRVKHYRELAYMGFIPVLLHLRTIFRNMSICKKDIVEYNPDVLILDEPTVGLDPQQIIEIRALISKLGKNHTVILSSHILSEIQAVCERIIIINQGYIIADGSTEELSKSISSDNSLIASIVGPPRQVLPAISAVEGVRSARVQGVASGSATEYFIEQRPDTDTRAALFDCVVQNGWKMVGLTSGSMSLEQVFLKLVEMSPEQAAAMFGRQLPEKAGEDSEEKSADNAADSGDPSDDDSKKGE